MTARAYLGRLSDSSYLERVQEGLQYIGAERLIGRNTRVFVKPNLTFPSYVPGVMTSPDAVDATLAALSDYTSRIVIGDSDSGGYNPFSMHEVYSAIGMHDIARRYGASVVNLTDLPRRPIRIPGRGRPISVSLPRLLTDDTDLLLTMPVPKVHMNTGVSLSFKNQWGCIPEPQDRLRLHPDFARVVLGVNRAISARLAVVDGRVGLDVTGPMRGSAVELDWLLVSDDLGAAARLSCELIGVPFDRIRHLRYAERHGAVPGQDEIELSQSGDALPRRAPLSPREGVDRLPGAVGLPQPSAGPSGVLLPRRCRAAQAALPGA